MAKVGNINIETLLDQREEYERRLKYIYRLHEKDLNLRNIVAFCSEVAELMNEWKHFKYWQKGKKSNRKKQLEEYADGLHFILSIFNAYKEKMPGIVKYEYLFPDEELAYEAEDDEILLQVVRLYEYASYLLDPYEYNFKELLQEYLNLGYMLGFTWDEIVKSFLKALSKNLKRLDDGY